MTPALQQFLAPLRAPMHREGKYLAFGQESGRVAHELAYVVISRRGGFSMGRIEWSPQWRAYMYRPHPEAILPLSAIAEVYVFIRELGGRQV